MAPIKALLEQAAHDNVSRDVVYYFGARTQADLYALEEIEKIKANWRARFDFIPVLSDEPEDSDWEGLRGFVTDHIVGLGDRLADHHVYMCGPPPMLDAAIAVCEEKGIESSNIHFDKFLDKSSQ
jgi:NAD(P)H-flavin reductase